MGGIRQIKELDTSAAPAFFFLVCDDVGNARIALPPVLVGAREVSDHGAHKRRVAWVCHIQNLVCLIANGTEQVGLCRIALWQIFPGAGSYHLCTSGFARATSHPWHVMQITGILRVGHIHDGSPIRLRLAIQWIARRPTVMTNIGNEPSTLRLDDRLVRGAALQVMKAHKGHISSFRRTPRHCLRRAESMTAHQHNRENEGQNDCAQPLPHLDNSNLAGAAYLPSSIKSATRSPIIRTAGRMALRMRSRQRAPPGFRPLVCEPPVYAWPGAATSMHLRPCSARAAYGTMRRCLRESLYTRVPIRRTERGGRRDATTIPC